MQAALTDNLRSWFKEIPSNSCIPSLSEPKLLLFGLVLSNCWMYLCWACFVDLICDFLSICPSLPSLLLPSRPFKTSLLFVCVALLFPLLPPSDLHLPPSIFTCQSASLVSHFFALLPSSCPFHPSPVFPGWRWNPGDQRREHQRYEARPGHRAHQERRPARPSGA